MFCEYAISSSTKLNKEIVKFVLWLKFSYCSSLFFLDLNNKLLSRLAYPQTVYTALLHGV